MPDHKLRRRDFIYQTLLSGSAAIGVGGSCSAEDGMPTLGQGEFKYRPVAGWGVLDAKTPVKNCSAMVTDSQGRIFLLTDHTSNNVIIYDADGRLVGKWGDRFTGAHGLEIVREEDREVLFITDLNLNRVFKTTLDGEILMELTYPKSTGKYASEKEFRPSWTLHLPNGEFFVLDGYGKDYILRYDRDGKLLNCFGGPEGGIARWGPHGGVIDSRGPGEPELVIAMSDQQSIKRLTLGVCPRIRIDLVFSMKMLYRATGWEWISFSGFIEGKDEQEVSQMGSGSAVADATVAAGMAGVGSPGLLPAGCRW